MLPENPFVGKPGLVIFDCDGVLVDSEPIANQVFMRMLNELGIAVTVEEMLERFVGTSMDQSLQLIAQRLGSTPPANFVEDYHHRTTVAFAAQLKQVPGIDAALERISTAYCVASNGEHRKMRTTLGITGLLPRFEGKLFSATDVARGKPAPDLFLHAARKLRVSPSVCLVIEDTATGVAAGVAAGMTVYGYAARTPDARLMDAGAHRTFSAMSELPQLIEQGLPAKS